MTGEQRQTLLGTKLHPKLGKIIRSPVSIAFLIAATILICMAIYVGGSMFTAYVPSEEGLQKVAKDDEKLSAEWLELVEEKEQVAEEKWRRAEEKERMAEEKEQLAGEKKEVAEEQKKMAEKKEEVAEVKENMAEKKEEVAEEKEKVTEEQKKVAEEQKMVVEEKKEGAEKKEKKEVVAQEKEKKEEVAAEFPPKLAAPDVHPPVEPRDYPTSHIHAGSNIFFIDTSCAFNYTPPDYSGGGGVALTLRAACSVYSAALVNPRHRVYLYQTCPLTRDYYNSSSEWVKRVLELENVYVVDLGRDPEGWFRGLPIEGFQDQVRKSKWPTIHLSDALRITLLYKYGGTYLDTDVIALKPLDGLGVNWGVSESDQYVGNAVINLEKGHRLATRILELMKSRFNPKGWVSIGPALFTEVLAKECNFTSRGALSGGYGYMKGCNFTLYPSFVAFAIPYVIHPILFSGRAWEAIKDILGHSYLLHFWNQLTSATVVEEGSAYDRLADTFCHNVYAHRHP